MPPSDRHFISVIIATYNRVESLRRTLAALEALHDDTFDHEWIVVDNNSADGTWQFLAEYASRQPRLRPLQDRRQGKSFALNAGLAVARGDIIAFTDDDVRPAKDWLDRMLEVYDSYGAAAVGGRVLLEGDVPLPRWLHRDLVPFLGLKDLGEQVIAVKPPESLVGANMSVRREVAEQVGGFRTDLGPRGRRYAVAYSEDNDFCSRISKGELGDVLYSPDVVTYHAMMPDKLTRSYFRQRAVGEGKATARLAGSNAGLKALPQFIRFVYASAVLAAGWLRHVREPDERFLREFRLIREWSIMVTRWRMA